jgi:hypothetical protein
MAKRKAQVESTQPDEERARRFVDSGADLRGIEIKDAKGKVVKPAEDKTVPEQPK